MEGYMTQWLGFIYGYYKRYYQLEHSTLCIYNTKFDCEEKKPSLDQVNIPLCEIVRNTTEKLQLEIRKSDGTWIYLRTETEGERQQWLKALGTAKACMLDATGVEYFSKSLVSRTNSNISGSSDSNHNVSSEESEIIIVAKFDETEQTDAKNNNETEVKNESSSPKQLIHGDLIDNNEHEIEKLCYNLKQKLSEIEKTILSNDCLSAQTIEECVTHFDTFKTFLFAYKSNDENPEKVDKKQNVENKKKIDKSGFTYFSTLIEEFENVYENAASRSETCLENGIEMGLFLIACDKFLAIYDKFGGNMFQPLKADVSGNIEKLRKAYLSNKEKYFLMKDLYYSEEFLKAKNDDGGPITGLIWLLRGMGTMAEFIRSLFSKNSKYYKQGSGAMDYAYQNTIMEYHNFVIKRMFRLGIKMCPDYETITQGLTLENGKGIENICEIMNTDAVLFSKSLFKLIELVEKFLP